MKKILLSGPVIRWQEEIKMNYYEAKIANSRDKTVRHISNTF
jgi:hypothetical protein